MTHSVVLFYKPILCLENVSVISWGSGYVSVLIYSFLFLSQVKWKKSDVKFEDRFDKYLDPSFFQHRVS